MKFNIFKTMFIVAFILASCSQKVNVDYGTEFDGERALQDVITQVEFGPRYPSSVGHQMTVDWLVSALESYDWDVSVQMVEFEGAPIKNIIAHRDSSSEKWVVLGAHYDTRRFATAELDEDLANEPVLGANDGASGVAVLLELARILPKDLDKDISLVFFDFEDNGGIGTFDWVLGSRAYVDSLESYPDSAVIVDMVGDADLQLYQEISSDLTIKSEIWGIAESLGHPEFIGQTKYNMLDDHTPFLQVGIPAITIIDFDYLYWHTTEDTSDKVSAESLQAVGEVLLVWLNP